MKTAIPVFDIRTYLDRLNIIKETSSEYHCSCPVCGSGGFKINKNNGKYYPFKCHCDLKAIREAIRPWREVKQQEEEKKASYPRNSRDTPKTEKGTQKPAKLARLPAIPPDRAETSQSSIADWLQKQGVPATAIETKYWYSSRAWVSRFGAIRLVQKH